MLKLQIEESEPCLAALLGAVLERTPTIPKNIAEADVHVKAQGNAIRALERRVARPRYFRRLGKAACDELVMAIRNDQNVL